MRVVYLHGKRFNEGQPRNADGEWTSGGGGAQNASKPAPQRVGAIEMVSPNVGENLSLDDAIAAIDGMRQRDVLRVTAEVDAIVGLQAHQDSAVGAWSDGAENSIVVSISGTPTWDQVETSAAMKGMLADQKAVIPFKVSRKGKDTMYQFDAPSDDIKAVHQKLSELGLEFHTLQPSSSGLKVWVFDQGSQLRDKVVKAGEHYEQRVKALKGTGEFLGSWDSRDEGRAAYQRVIDRNLGPDQRARWDGIYHRWRETNPVLHGVGRTAQKAAVYLRRRGSAYL